MSKCRFCGQNLDHEFIDLVSAPPSNAFIKQEQLNEHESYFPLKLYVCAGCFLVQVEQHSPIGEIFSPDYVYFSSYSRSWLKHCQAYAEMAIRRFSLTSTSKVVEIASNDGYLLRFFKEKEIPVLGIEPTRSTADVAITHGIETIVRFFGAQCALDLVRERGKADLIVANNVLAHVPEINDIARGIKSMLHEGGVFTGEFPHLLKLVSENQFDTIYHEHFSYFSFFTISRIFAENGLRIFDVEELPTHGGSLRIYADHGSQYELSPRVAALTAKEKKAGIDTLAFYAGFQESTDRIKNRFLAFLLDAKAKGHKVAGYGAAAKGNTLLNYAGVKRDLVSFVADASPYKQNRFLPGSRIPVVAEAHLRQERPDYVVILPWNLRAEVSEQLGYIRDWGGKFVVAIPSFEVF